MKANCAGRRRRGVGDMSVSATCSPGRNLVIVEDLADVTISGVDKVRNCGRSEALWSIRSWVNPASSSGEDKLRGDVNVTDW